MKKILFCISLFINAYCYKAAGILPYAIDTNGNIVLLIGLSCVHKNQASDFGGLKDKEDHENPVHTAAREACEELIFVFDSDANFKHILQLHERFGTKFAIKKVASTTFKYLQQKTQDAPYIINDDYIMYLVKIDYDETLPSRLQERRKKYQHAVPFCWQETTQLIWIPVNSLLQKKSVRETISYYRPFVESLKKARDQKIFPH